MTMYDDIIRDCCRMLCEFGRVSEDIMMLIEPQFPQLTDAIVMPKPTDDTFANII